MENMEDFCVSHNYSQRDRLLFPRHHRHRRPTPPPPPPPPPLPSSLYTCIYIVFFRIEKNHPEIVLFARDYASRDQIYHLTLRNTTVRTQTPLENYTTYIYTHTI